MKSFQSKLPNVGTTIFTVMSRLADEHGAINLSQGFPDFDPPKDLLERISHYFHSGYNQYAPMVGVASLREATARKIERLYGIQSDPETEITVTSGATEALFCAIHATVKPGDEVIVFDPAYDSYEPAIMLAGAKPIHFPMSLPNFSIDWERLSVSLSDRTRMVIINTPHNPTGAVFTHEDLTCLADLLRPYQCYVLSDEVYEHIIFDGQRHSTILAHEELSKKCFAVFSFGKTYHATGWKVGYCVAPSSLSREFRRVHQFNTYTTITPVQYALADYLDEHPEHYLGLPDFYQEKRNLFQNLMKESPFKLKTCRGTYFQLADYSAISDAPDTEFARWLTMEHGVAVIPVSVFCSAALDAHLVRFCFAKEAATLERAANILGNL